MRGVGIVVESRRHRRWHDSDGKWKGRWGYWGNYGYCIARFMLNSCAFENIYSSIFSSFPWEV